MIARPHRLTFLTISSSTKPTAIFLCGDFCPLIPSTWVIMKYLKVFFEAHTISNYLYAQLPHTKLENQTFLEATHISINPFWQYRADGFIGLAFKDEAWPNTTPFFYNLLQQGVIKESVFTFYMNRYVLLFSIKYIWQIHLMFFFILVEMRRQLEPVKLYLAVPKEHTWKMVPSQLLKWLKRDTGK